MARKFIYSAETEEHFYEKIDEFHDEYVLHLLLSGASDFSETIEQIKMTKNPEVSLPYCKKVIYGLTHLSPSVMVSFLDDQSVRLQCIFTYIDNLDYGHRDLIMIQNVIGWPEKDKFSCQVWYLQNISLESLEGFWHE